MCAMSSRVSDSSSPQPSVATHCHFKILIPSPAVGSIMGGKGEVMSKLEKMTRTKIVVSGMKDFYPGTRDRVCLISGTIDDIMLVNRIIMENLRAHPHLCYGSSKGGKPKKDLQHNKSDTGNKSEMYKRPKQVKVIVPQSTASKIIGKNGNNIEQLKINSGSTIQLSRKAFPVVLRERIVTISGELEGNEIACRLLLRTIADDTDVDFYKNVSYSEARYPLPSTYMVGSPFASNTNHTSNARFERPETTIDPSDVRVFLETYKETLKNMDFSQNTITRSSEAIMALCEHKVLDLCLSMLINWFYPRAFSVYMKNGGVPSTGSQPTLSAAEINEMEQLCASSMFISKIETEEDQPGTSGLVNYGYDDKQSDEDYSNFQIAEAENVDYNDDDTDYENWLLSKRDTWKFE